MRIHMVCNQRVCMSVITSVWHVVRVYIYVRARIRAYACVWSVNGGSSHLKGVL